MAISEKLKQRARLHMGTLRILEGVGLDPADAEVYEIARQFAVRVTNVVYGADSEDSE